MPVEPRVRDVTALRPDSCGSGTVARLRVHPSACILSPELNGRSMAWVTPTFLF